MLTLLFLETIDDFRRNSSDKGGIVTIKGLDRHVSSSSHKLALRNQVTELPHTLSPREERLQRIAEEYNWTYQLETNWETSYLRYFQFFKTRPIEKKYNVLTGVYGDHNAAWEICDITFDEGALLATEVYHTTVQMIILPFSIPKFIIEKEGFFDKIFDKLRELSGYKDIDFSLFTRFSNKFLLKGEDEQAIRMFFNSRLIHYLEKKRHLPY